MALQTYNSINVLQILVCVVYFCALADGFNPWIIEERVEERECVGTTNGFSSSGTADFRYSLLRRRYLGCTHVLGNLEITHLDDHRISYDLSFLKDIRYVSGYVLIALVGEVEKLLLPNLEIIRGNDTFNFQGEEYSLMVALTSGELDGIPAQGLTTLGMPKLKEITLGKVIFIQNPSLGYIDTVHWEPIMKGRLDAVHFEQDPCNFTASNKTDADICQGGGMWGPEPSLCQEVLPSPPACHKQCDYHCFGPGHDECCHEACAIGCFGPTASECRSCKDFMFEKSCVPYCPELTYQLTQQCVKYTPLNRL